MNSYRKRIFYLIQLVFLVFIFSSCSIKSEKIKPTISAISESIYASGLVKSKNQYQAFVTINGTIDQIFVSEGDTVKAGQQILSIANDAQHFAKENAELAVGFADLNNNKAKLSEATGAVNLAIANLKNDSILYRRQQALWNEQVGTKVEYEGRELAYKNAKAVLYSAKVKYTELKRQLTFTSSQAKQNLSISSKLENDYTLRSDIDGVVYSITKEKGEIVSPQMPLAVIGNDKIFILEMQVDEYDILKVETGLQVLVTMDSYKAKVFEAKVSKIYPMMDKISKTFLVEATFTNPPKTLYPNISFEANVIIQTKAEALLIPRNFMIDDSTVMKSNGDLQRVKTGLKDYQKIEIIAGLGVEDEIKRPLE